MMSISVSARPGHRAVDPEVSTAAVRAAVEACQSAAWSRHPTTGRSPTPDLIPAGRPPLVSGRGPFLMDAALARAVVAEAVVAPWGRRSSPVVAAIPASVVAGSVASAPVVVRDGRRSPEVPAGRSAGRATTRPAPRPSLPSAVAASRPRGEAAGGRREAGPGHRDLWLSIGSTPPPKRAGPRPGPNAGSLLTQVDGHRQPAPRRTAERESAASLLGGAAGDVEAQAGGPAAARPPAQDVGSDAQPGSGVGDQQPGPAARAGPEVHGEGGAVRRVCEHVAEQRVDQRLEVGPAHRDGQRAGGDVGADVAVGVLGHTDQNATRPATTSAASHPAASVARRRAASITEVTALHRVRPLRSWPRPRRAGGLGVEPQRGERGADAVRGSATVSRSSRSSSLIRPASVFNAPATTPTSTGASGSARASSSPRASRCDTAATSIVARTRPRASRSATSRLTPRSTTPSPAAAARPGRRPR